MYDLVIRNGVVIDGTGAPRREADVGIQDGRVVEIGAISGSAREEIDAKDRIVAPGFIDIHTHYDAQAFWDPKLSPSSHHGVTTVVCGNCGFSIAPLSGRTEDAEYLLEMLARVEGMPVESLRAGVPWNWQSFGSYLDALEGKLAINAGFMVGHSALRRTVMGARAVGQQATSEELELLCETLRESLRAGGLGLSSTICPIHVDANGDPVPSRAASDEELFALARVVGEFEGTCLEFQPNNLGDFDTKEMERMSTLSRISGGRPLNWNLLIAVAPEYGRYLNHLSASDHAAANGGNVTALALCQPLISRINLLSGMVLDGLDHWSDLFKLPLPQRIEAFSDPSVRPALAEAFGKMRGLLSLWSDLSAWSVAEVHREENKMFVGKTIGDVARAQGKEPIDAFLDLALSEELKTSFLGPPIGADDDSWRIRAESWHDDRTIIGGSDAGAHLDMLDTFAFSSIVLGEGVRRRRLMSLEKAVHQITGLPARHLGLVDRGELRPGASADLVVFDPETVDVGPVHTRTDLPAGAPRLYAEAVGVDYVLVNGVEIVGHGEYTGAIGGKILRSGRDTRTVSIH